MNIKELRFSKSQKRLDYKKEISELNAEITKKRKEKPKQLIIDSRLFMKDNKKWFLILDIAIIFIILFNLGALTITHAMVMKVEPDKIITKFNPITNKTEEFIEKGTEPPIFREVNPVMAKSQGFIEHPESLKLMYSFIKFIIFWSLITFTYLFYRKRTNEYWKLEILTFYVLFYMIAMGTDFINDFGFWIGKIIY